MAKTSWKFGGAPWGQGFVKTGRSVIGTAQDVVQRIGSAIIGGDFSGDARGEQAIDIQGWREVASQVAAGKQSIAFGAENQVLSEGGIAIGRGNTVASDSNNGVAIGFESATSGSQACCFGFRATAEGALTTAVGSYALALADGVTAIGANAHGRLEYCTALGGPLHVMDIGIAAPGEEWGLAALGGGPTILMTHCFRASVGGAECALLIPANARFFVQEFGVVLAWYDSFSGPLAVQFGTREDKTKLLLPTECPGLTAPYTIERFVPREAWSSAGETSLYATVTQPGTGGTVLVRYYWLGVLMEIPR